jgi:hypothetical protein
MPRLIRRSLALLTFVSATLLLVSCSQELPSDSRLAVDALDKPTADARKARLSNIDYDALIDIAAS